jgi:hypothetical protein
MFSGILTAVLQVVNFVSGSAFQNIVGSVTHMLDISKIADTVKFSTATVAECDVVVARMLILLIIHLSTVVVAGLPLPVSRRYFATLEY